MSLFPSAPGGAAAFSRSSLRIRRAAAVLPLLALPALAGCSLFDKTPPPPCPQIGILADAQKMTVFRPGGKDITDVIYKAEVAAISGACKSADGGKAIDMTVSLKLIATRGPASKGESIKLPYFVSVVDHQSQQILAKSAFDSPLDFPSGARRAGVVEEVSEHIPLTQGRKGPDYDVLVGLQLTPEQLKYNRQEGTE